MEGIRIYEMPDCKMVSSGIGMFGQEKFAHFEEWFSSQPRSMFPKDYLFWDGAAEGFCWVYLYEDGMTVPDGFDIIDFKGGLYAVATGIDGQSGEEEKAAIRAFVESHGFIIDCSRPELGNCITPPAATDALGYVQMDYYIPIQVKG